MNDKLKHWILIGLCAGLLILAMIKLTGCTMSVDSKPDRPPLITEWAHEDKDFKASLELFDRAFVDASNTSEMSELMGIEVDVDLGITYLKYALSDMPDEAYLDGMLHILLGDAQIVLGDIKQLIDSGEMTLPYQEALLESSERAKETLAGIHEILEEQPSSERR